MDALSGTRRLCLAALLWSSAALSWAVVQPISQDELIVPPSLSFSDQLQKHASILTRLGDVLQQIELDKKAAEEKNSLKDYKVAEADLDNVKKALAPYAIAEAKARELVKVGYVLRTIEPRVCKLKSECVAVDAMTAFFFFVGENRAGLAPELKNEASQAEKTKVTVNGFDLTTFVKILGEKPLDFLTFGLLPSLRDAIIPPTDTGEIAKLIRDPIKRPVEIIQDARDRIIPKNDNGEIARIVRDPIQCTVGRLFGGCR